MLSLLPILVPIILIFIKAVLNTLPQISGLEGLTELTVVQIFNFIGTPIIALVISVLLAVYSLVPHLEIKIHTHHKS